MRCQSEDLKTGVGVSCEGSWAFSERTSQLTGSTSVLNQEAFIIHHYDERLIANPLAESALHLEGQFDLKSFERLLSNIFFQSKLEQLSFNFHLSSQHIKIIEKHLPKCKNLKNISFSSCGINDETISGLVPALIACPLLTVIDLEKNKITSDASARVVELITNPGQRIEKLRLNNNSIGDKGAKSILTASLTCSQSIKTIDLSKCGITCDGLIGLSKSIQSPSSLQKLTIALNKIGPQGAKALKDLIINQNINIRHLTLFGNCIKDEGTEYLCEGLISPNCLVTSLALSINGITDKGAAKLAYALLNNKTLHNLYLSTNEITSNGASMLARACARRDAITSILSFSNNQIGDSAMEAVAAALQLKSLGYLSLYNNSITDVGANVLLEASKNFTTGKDSDRADLYLFGNSISPSKLEEMSKYINIKGHMDVDPMLCTVRAYGCHETIEKVKSYGKRQQSTLLPDTESNASIEIVGEGGSPEFFPLLKQEQLTPIERDYFLGRVKSEIKKFNPNFFESCQIDDSSWYSLHKLLNFCNTEKQFIEQHGQLWRSTTASHFNESIQESLFFGLQQLYYWLIQPSEKSQEFYVLLQAIHQQLDAYVMVEKWKKYEQVSSQIKPTYFNCLHQLTALTFGIYGRATNWKKSSQSYSTGSVFAKIINGYADAGFLKKQKVTSWNWMCPIQEKVLIDCANRCAAARLTFNLVPLLISGAQYSSDDLYQLIQYRMMMGVEKVFTASDSSHFSY